MEMCLTTYSDLQYFVYGNYVEIAVLYLNVLLGNSEFFFSSLMH